MWMFKSARIRSSKRTYNCAAIHESERTAALQRVLFCATVNIADSVTILPYVVAEASVIGANASVGPFSRLRMHAEASENTHIGNFVELKKTKLGRGAKASHLAYLGDSIIGSGANIGAGTITCNYDGQRKHQTNIADNVFVGSNSTLVAPRDYWRGCIYRSGIGDHKKCRARRARDWARLPGE